MTARLYLYDTTLRDGAQTQGVDFSAEDKRQIAAALDRLGIDYIEAGFPGANPLDTDFFAAPPVFSRAKLTAFGMTKRAGRSAANDPGLAAVLDAKAGAVCLVGKASAYQAERALEISRGDNLECIAASIAAAKARGRDALFDAEHFFDGYAADPDYALACLRSAHEAGADWLVLCDTNGGTMPEAVFDAVSAVRMRLPLARLGIHAHDDTGQAAAVSLAAVRAGARLVQGTLGGLGERCGNANLITLIATLSLKDSYAEYFTLGLAPGALAQLTPTARLLDEILNRAPARHAPYVGTSAFAHKGGLHAAAVLKEPKTYEHVPPEAVGNARKILVSDQAGRSSILSRLSAFGIDIGMADPRLARVLDEVKMREQMGYAYDGAEASFELLARRALGQVPDYFSVESFRVMVERRRNAAGEMETVSEAVVKLTAGGEQFHNVAIGNGPVNALDAALRKDLGRYSSVLADLTLADYKVRILTSGTEAVTRVLIESADAQGARWWTVGVSANIVDASFEALTDSITYKLLRDGARL